MYLVRVYKKKKKRALSMKKLENFHLERKKERAWVSKV